MKKRIIFFIFLLFFLNPIFSIEKIINLNPDKPTYFSIDTFNKCLVNLSIEDNIDYNIYYKENKVTIEFLPNLFQDSVKIKYNLIDCSKVEPINVRYDGCKIELDNLKIVCPFLLKPYRKKLVFKRIEITPNYIIIKNQKIPFKEFLILKDNNVPEKLSIGYIIYDLPKMEKELEIYFNGAKLLERYKLLESLDETKKEVLEFFLRNVYFVDNEVVIVNGKTDPNKLKNEEIEKKLKKILLLFFTSIIIFIILILFFLKVLNKKKKNFIQ